MTGAEASTSDTAQPINGDNRNMDLAQLRQALRKHSSWRLIREDQHLRAIAELDNVRKRAQRDVENASRYGLEKFAIELLPVLDSLQGAVSNSARADAKSLAAGQEATLKLPGQSL